MIEKLKYNILDQYTGQLLLALEILMFLQEKMMLENPMFCER